MPHISCRRCKKIFYSKPSWIKKGAGKYCSVYCSSQSRKNGRVIKCYICNQEAYKPLSQLQKSKYKKYFCSKSCSIVWQNTVFVKEKHPNWKGGFFSYRDKLLKHNIQQSCNLCKIKDLKVLAVHHIDKNRKNNKINNLAWLCHNCHFLVHHYEKERTQFFDLITC